MTGSLGGWWVCFQPPLAIWNNMQESSNWVRIFPQMGMKIKYICVATTWNYNGTVVVDGSQKNDKPSWAHTTDLFSKKTDIVTVFSDARSPPAIAQRCNSLHACSKPQLWLKTRVPKQTTYFGPPRIIQFRVVNHF